MVVRPGHAGARCHGVARIHQGHDATVSHRPHGQGGRLAWARGRPRRARHRPRFHPIPERRGGAAAAKTGAEGVGRRDAGKRPAEAAWGGILTHAGFVAAPRFRTMPAEQPPAARRWSRAAAARMPQPDSATLAATSSAAILQRDQRDGFIIGRALVRMRMRRGSAWRQAGRRTASPASREQPFERAIGDAARAQRVDRAAHVVERRAVAAGRAAEHFLHDGIGQLARVVGASRRITNASAFTRSPLSSEHGSHAGRYGSSAFRASTTFRGAVARSGRRAGTRCPSRSRRDRARARGPGVQACRGSRATW